jgi:hypothetical protein
LGDDKDVLDLAVARSWARLARNEGIIVVLVSDPTSITAVIIIVS